MPESLFDRFGRVWQPGETLFRQGELGDVMYVVQSGAIQITKHVAGEDRVIAVVGPGDFVGEMAILNDRPRSATATVIAPTRCLMIDARTLETMVTKNAEIAVRLIKKLASRLDSADALVQILMQRDPRARFLLALCRLADLMGEVTPRGIRLQSTVESIAREVSADLPAAKELMKRLKRLRLVDEGDGSIWVSDIARLRDFLEFLEAPTKPTGKVG